MDLVQLLMVVILPVAGFAAKALKANPALWALLAGGGAGLRAAGHTVVNLIPADTQSVALLSLKKAATGLGDWISLSDYISLSDDIEEAGVGEEIEEAGLEDDLEEVV